MIIMDKGTDKNEKPLVIEAVTKALRALWNSFPSLMGVLLLVSLISSWLPKSYYSILFRGNYVWDSLIGSVIGSILAGNPITSYVIGGEFLDQGIGLLAVTAFLVSWVTVGVVQLPAESILLGKRFALARNISAFFFSMIVAVITVLVVSLL